MARTALRSVGDAIEATRTFLLPVSLRRIAALAVVVLFMGTPGTPIPANPQFADPVYWRYSDPTEAANGEGSWSVTDASIYLLDPGTWPVWLLAGVGLVALLGLVYALLGVVMRFVLVEALRSDDVRIRRDGRAHLGGALQVLGLRIAIWGLVIAVVAAIGLAITDAGPWSVDGPGVGLLGAVATLAVLLAWAAEVCTLQFVVPTMIARESGVVAGWRRFWPTLRTELVEFGLYALVRVLLGIAVGIAASVVVLVVLALAGVVLGTVAAIVVVLAGGFGSLGSVSLAVLGLLLAVFVLVGIAAGATVAVPFQCYLWIYALLVLGDVDPELDLIPGVRERVRDGANAVE